MKSIGRTEEAILELDKMIIKSEYDIIASLAYQKKADFLIESKKYKDALEVYQEMMTIFPEINKSDIDYDSVLENLNYRDITDSTRDIAPLKKAKDAYSVDVSDLSIDEVFDKVLNIIKK